MESENAPQPPRNTISPMVARLIITFAVALMIIGSATQLLPDYIIVPSFLIFCIGLIVASASKPVGMDIRYIVLTIAVSFAFFILLNRYEALSGGYFAFGKSLGFFLGEIPLLSVFLITIPALLTQNFIRNLRSNIYFKSLVGAVYTSCGFAVVMFAGPTIDILYWENTWPSPATIVPLFLMSYFLSFAGLQLSFAIRFKLAVEILLAWITFWSALIVLILRH